MKVIYFSYPNFADCNFPLIKELQDKGIDVHYYMPLHRKFQRSSILDFKNQIRGVGFVKASTVEDMLIYKDCLDLNRLYFIKGYTSNKFWIPSWLIWVYTLFHIKRQNADIIHIDWQYRNCYEKFIFRFVLGKRKIMTVHDPIMHSGQPKAEFEEKKRIWSFQWADRLILLNRVQEHEFIRKYSIPKEKLSFSQLPSYDSISKILLVPSQINGDYILFFGQILPYKGLEFLLEAMKIVHENCPNLKLVVAGGGEILFDKSQYENIDHIVWMHRYIGIGELAGLLKEAKFVVCPYKDATQSGVVKTAYAMGAPIVASKVGTLSIDVIDNKTGRLVPPCDVKALAQAIIELYNDTKLLLDMKNNIILREKLDGTLNKKIAEEYIKIYNNSFYDKQTL